MPSPKKLIASAAVAAGLLGGGVVGVVLGVPGVSGAQTVNENQTVPDAPSTTVPDSDGETTPDRPARGDRENCPEKDGAEGTAPSGTSLNLRRGAGGRV